MDTINIMDTKDDEYCFICLDKDKITSLDSIKQYYWTTCNCNESVHYWCFQKWIVINNSCPLCRKGYLSKVVFCKKLVNNIFITAPKLCCSYMLLLLIVWSGFIYTYIFLETIYRAARYDSIYHE